MFDDKKRDTVCMLLDISKLKEREAELEHLAAHDFLTGLLRMRALHDELNWLITRARRRGGRLAVLCIDLDAFKLVNDTFGHDAGDQVLKEVGKRLLDVVRETDHIARAGGDEFVINLEDIADTEVVTQIAEKILLTLGKSIPLSIGHSVCVGASIGIGMFPDDAWEIDQLLRYADQAMYQNKAEGGNRYTHYRGSLEEASSPSST